MDKLTSFKIRSIAASAVNILCWYQFGSSMGKGLDPFTWAILAVLANYLSVRYIEEYYQLKINGISTGIEKDKSGHDRADEIIQKFRGR